MKTTRVSIVSLFALIAWLAGVSHLQGQGTAFTYQGRLNQNGTPYTGSAEFQFTLWNASSAGSNVATNNPASVVVGVTNGLFTASLDFGTTFPGDDRWLQTDVRTVIGPYTTLSPRQKLTPTPYAITAGSVVSGGISPGTYNNPVTFNNAANSLAGAFTGNGAGLSNVNATTLNGLTSASFWKTNGNAGANPANGAFIGTSDDLPLEFRVNGQRALLLVPNTNGTPSVIGGTSNNTLHTTAVASVIAGGQFNSIQENSESAVIGGGSLNRIRTNSALSVIGGGQVNVIDNLAGTSVIAGGNNNRVQTNALSSTISGGFRNTIQGGSSYSVIGGGNSNTNGGSFATVPGGQLNEAQGDWSFAAGRRAKANHAGTFVWADSLQNEDFASSANFQFLIRASGGVGINTNNTTGTTLNVAGTVQATTFQSDSFVGSGGGLSNVNAATVGGLGSSNFWRTGGNAGTTPGANFIGTTDNQPLEIKVNGGGAFRLEPTGSNSVNVIGGYAGNFIMPGKIGATIGGGGAGVYFGTSQSNLVAGDFGTVGGGGGNAARSLATTIAGGVNNLIEEFGAYSVIGGGFANVVGTNAQYATIGGGLQNRVGRLSFDAMIGGGALNSIGAQAYDVTIGGGLENAVEDDAWYSSIGGGNSNRIARGSQAATLAGGQENRIGTNSGSATISGGVGNAIDSSSGRSAIGGGFANIIQSQATGATISGGTSNTIQTLATSAAIGGGQLNSIQSLARNATIPGGFSNSVAGPFGFAAGRRAKANHPGAFVWADSTDADFTSMTTNQFRIRAGGGAEIVGGSNQPAFHYTGTRTGGFSTAVGLAENLNATGQSAPALRIVNAGGNSIDGALSVSAGGTGYIAKFGNASTFVADLATNGTFSAMTFNPTSDRNAKENFSRVDARAILDKVATLPITRWNFKINNGSEHLGPMAQDFHAAFGLNGEDDKHIATVDADGVALAAIQGLNQKVEEQRDELKQKQTEITELKARLEKLERMLNEMSGGAR